MTDRLLAPAIGALVLLLLSAASTDGLQAADQRARVVESTLKDLSAANDANLGSIGSTPPVFPIDPLTGRRVDLNPQPRPSSESLVRGDVQSSLHRLRRETTSEQTEDERKARVNDTLDRASQQGPDG